MIRFAGMAPSSVAAVFGQRTVLARLFRPIFNWALPDDAVEVTVRSGPARGIRILIAPKGEKFYWTGAHEQHVQDALARILEPGMRFWDAGAHAGFFSFLASRIVGDEGVVHAFEPQPDSRDRLVTGVGLNSAANVTVHPIALTNIDGDAVLHRHAESPMWSLVSERGEADGITVRCQTIDSMAEQLGAPDLIKIDVEGAELEVIRGGRATAEKAHPIFIVELSDESMVDQAKAMLPSHTFEHLGANHWLLR
jgi:FkbM family methyltransferase